MSQWNVERVIEQLKGDFQSLENLRQEMLARRALGQQRMLIAIALAVVIGLLVASTSGNVIPLMVSVGIGGVVCLGLHSVYSGGSRERYREAYKNGLMKEIVRAVEPEMSYEGHLGISQEMFMRSGLYGTRPDRYHSEDFFQGRIGKTQITFAEVHAEEKKRRTNSKGRSETYWVTIFKGLFIIADFHKHFKSPVSVMPDFAERNFGWFGKKLQSLGGGVQRLENPEFEEAFVVRGADPVETRYLLTPAMQERLLDLRNRMGRDLRAGFKDSQVWLTIPNKGDWFEPNLEVAAFNHRQVSVILGQMKSCCDIVQELDLNTRIWTKE